MLFVCKLSTAMTHCDLALLSLLAIDVNEWEFMTLESAFTWCNSYSPVKAHLLLSM